MPKMTNAAPRASGGCKMTPNESLQRLWDRQCGKYQAAERAELEALLATTNTPIQAMNEQPIVEHVFALSGDKEARLSLPDQLTREEVDELDDWITLVRRQLRRRFTPFAPAFPFSPFEDCSTMLAPVADAPIAPAPPAETDVPF